MEITFEIGKENMPCIEPIDTAMLENSIFSDQYKCSLKAIDDYIGETKRLGSVKIAAEGLNNVFAFIGDRGSGKSSCMMSVGEFLKQPDKEVVKKLSLEDFDEVSFMPLDLVDPSFFDQQHNILSIIIAKLYRKYETLASEKNIALQKKRKLIDAFARTQQDLNNLIEGKTDYIDDLSHLVELAAAVNLKKDISELVSEFFECFEMKNTKLLLMIDDIDLNTSQADRMAEQIRKYFIQKDIVILMSLKLDQLELIKRLSYVKEYSKLLEHDNITLSELDDMVEKYLAKFIPHTHRIYMPDSEYYMDSPLVLSKEYNLDWHFPSVKQAVPSLIFEKTRYLFYNSPQQVSYIVPRNLRELRQLVSMLYMMDDYWNDETKAESNLYNQTLFKKYLFDNWATNNLNGSDKSVIDEVLEIEEPAQCNAYVLYTLLNRFPSLKPNDEDKSKSRNENGVLYEIRMLNDNKILNYNISIGDILGLMDMVERQNVSQEDRRFLFLIRTVYSIKLYEAYNEVTSHIGRVDGEDEDADTLVMRNDDYLGLSPYDKLVAGRFSNSRLKDILPKDSNSPSRTNRLINLGKLHSLIKECVETWDRCDANKIKMAEFFMLCVARDFSTQSNDGIDYYDPLYRTRQDVNYAVSLKNKRANAFFDVNAFFFNITRIKECYSRFDKGEEFFQKADADRAGKSLWFDFKIRTLQIKQGKEYTDEIKNDPARRQAFVEQFDMHKWLSFCSFRNAEILRDFYLSLYLRDNKTSNDIELLKMLFSKVAEYSIHTYETTADGSDYYSINFKFAEDVAAMLDTVKGNIEQENVFNSIYASKVESFRIDVDTLMLRRRNLEIGYPRQGLIESIKKKYPVFKQDDKYSQLLRDTFEGKPNQMRSNEMRDLLNELNRRINGEPEANAENAVPVQDNNEQAADEHAEQQADGDGGQA